MLKWGVDQGKAWLGVPFAGDPARKGKNNHLRKARRPILIMSPLFYIKFPCHDVRAIVYPFHAVSLLYATPMPFITACRRFKRCGSQMHVDRGQERVSIFMPSSPPAQGCSVARHGTGESVQSDSGLVLVSN